MSIIIKNIKQIIGIQSKFIKKLSGQEMSTLNTIENAYLIIKDVLIILLKKRLMRQGNYYSQVGVILIPILFMLVLVKANL